MLKTYLKNFVVLVITWQAKLVLKKYKPRVIAVTGSVGKTSTKDAIYAALSAHAFVRKSEKSFNGEVGVPLTILGRPNGWINPLTWGANILAGFVLILTKQRYPEWLVLEVGADRPGDIKAIASWLRADIVVVTRFAPVPVHVEFFSSPEAVFAEKAELIRSLKTGGTLILSRDDEKVMELAQRAPNTRVLTFGFSRGADVSGTKSAIAYEGRAQQRHPRGMSFILAYKGESVPVELSGLFGRQGLFALLAAAAVDIALGRKLPEISVALSKFQGPPGRMKLIPGVKQTTLIDDTYNSSPVAVREALDALKHLKIKGKRYALLADMLELGAFSVQEHKAAGAYVFGKTEMLVAVGVRSRDTALGALEAGFEANNILQFDDARQAGKAIEKLLGPGDVILIKGSQGMRMERAVEELMAHPEEKERLLVRQELEWKER